MVLGLGDDSSQNNTDSFKLGEFFLYKITKLQQTCKDRRGAVFITNSEVN